VLGTRFKVDFNNVSDNKGTLVASRFGYRVRHKSSLGGARAIASIWNYGCELEYLEDDLVTKKRLWLCEQCHLAGVFGAARRVNGTRFIHDHMKQVHRIDPDTSLLPNPTPTFASPFKATAVAGSNTIVAHTP
jgi:hypothetical protein